MAGPVVRAVMAADILATNLGNLHHPDAGALKLVQFSHQSDGLQKLSKQLGEALVKCLEDRGWRLCNGESEAVAWLEGLGYAVEGPGEGPAQYLGEGP